MNALWEVDWLHFEQMDVSVGDFESQFRQIDRAARWSLEEKSSLNSQRGVCSSKFQGEFEIVFFS